MNIYQNKTTRFLRRTLGTSFMLYYLNFTLFVVLLSSRSALAQAPPSTPAPPPPPPIVVDQASQGQTSLETAPNEVPIVNIAQPNGAGLSHNLFERFNVEERGLILNNSNTLGQSKLAGALMANPNFGGGAQARLILNEVTGTSRSELRGYTEIFGGRADYVLANPYGITCDGCGFINTPRATLSSGRPQFQNGNLHRLEVERGNITITGRGSNTGTQAGENANVDYFDLVSRTVTIQGPLHAAKLRVYGGQNDFYYANQHIVQRASGSDGNSPTWALDAAAIGSMYANTIFIKLTEKGAGARVAGQMAASGDDVIITADGMLEIVGQLSAQRNIDLNSQSNININSSTYARQNININAAGQITVGANGRIFSSGDTSIMAQEMRVDGQIAAGVSDAGILSRQSRFIANLRNGLENLGIIAAGMELQMTAGGSVSNQGLLYSNGAMNLYFNELRNDEGAEILSSGNLFMARNGSQGRAARMTNQSGRIESRSGDITIYSDTIENKRNNSVRVPQIANDPSLPGNAYSADHYDWHTGSASAITHRAEIVGNQNAESGTIFSGGDINLYANEVRNKYSVIYAGADLNINSNSILNEGTQLGDLETTIYWIYDINLGDHCTGGKYSWGSCKGEETLWGAKQYKKTKRVLNPSVLMASLGAGDWLRFRDANGQDSVTVENRDRAASLNPSFVTSERASAPVLPSFDLPDTSLPTGSNGLFVLSSNPNSPYLIESNPLFTSIDQYIGSNYFFERSGLRLSDFEYYQWLGDPFYETRLIQKQIFEQRGTRFLEKDILDDAEQMLRLFDNAAAAYEDLELVPGISLSAETVKHLTRDIIWMEKRVVQGKNVLVPKLYLAEVTNENSEIRGGVLRARNIDIKAASIRNEGGGIIADENLKLLTTRGNIENVLGVIDGGTVVIDSAANILNEGGSIMGERLLAHAVGDIVNETLTERIQTNENNYQDLLVSKAFIGTRADFTAQAEARESAKEAALARQALGEEAANEPAQSEALLGHIAGSAFINPSTGRTVDNILEVLGAQESGFLGMTAAEGSILNKGARIVSEGQTQLTAGRDIELSALALDDKSEIHYEGGFEKSFKRKHLGAGLSSAGDLKISAGGDLSLWGSSIHSDSQVNINVAGDVNVMHLLDEDFHDKQITTEEKEFLNDTTTIERWGHNRQTVIGSGISAGANLNLNAGGRVLLSGSRLKAGEDLRIGDALVVENEDGNLLSKDGSGVAGLFILSAESKDESWYEKKTSHSTLGVQVKQTEDFVKDMNILQNASHIDASGTLSLNSREDILIQGSHLKSGSTMEINAAGGIAVLSAFEHKRHQEGHTESSLSDVDFGADTSGDNFKLTTSLSYEGQSFDTESKTISQVTSILLSGGNLRINAKKDVTIIAGNRPENEEPTGVIAYGNVDIKSTEGNLSILSANDVDSLIKEESEFTTTLGFSIGNAIVEAGRTTYRTGQELSGAKEKSVTESQAKADSLRTGAEDPNAARKNPYKDLVKGAQALNFLGSLSTLAGSVARAVSSIGTYGFYLEGSVSVGGKTTKTQNRSERAVGSLVQSITGDVNLDAKKELKIIGSDIVSNEGNINLYGGEKVTIAAAAQNQSMDRDTSIWSDSGSMDTTGRISGSYADSGENLNTEGAFYRHSSLLTNNGTLNITSGGDALIKGAVGKAKHIRTNIAAELKVETIQNTSNTELKGYSYNVGGNSDGGFNAGGSSTRGTGEYRWANTQSALIATESVNIQADTLSLIGSKIANEYKTEEGQTVDGGNLTITANEITYQDLVDIDRSDYQKLGGGVGLGLGLKEEEGNLSSVNLQFGSAGHDKQGITRATIGLGTIISPSNLSKINRDISKAQEITKNDIQEAVDINVNVDVDLITDPKKYVEDIAGIPEDLGELGDQIWEDSKELADKADNLFDYGHFDTDEGIVADLAGKGNSALGAGEREFLEDLFNSQKEADSIDAMAEQLLWQEAIRSIPAAGGLARDELSHEIMNGNDRLALLRGNHRWEKGTNISISTVYDPNTGKYLEIRRQYSLETGSWSFVNRYEITREQFYEVNPQGDKNTPTWCNTYASGLGVEAYEAPSLQSHNNRKGWTANQIYNNLHRGSYNNEQGSFERVNDWQAAERYARDGYFVVVSYRNPRSNGHIAVLQGGYNPRPGDEGISW